MPSAFDDCCNRLQQDGVDGETACRACEIAFWDAFGMRKDAADQFGVDPGGDISGRAWQAVSELAEGDGEGERFIGIETEIPATLSTPVKLEAYGIPGGTDTKEFEEESIFREVQLLAPGSYIDANGRKFEVTDAHLREYAANFDPRKNPPIILDHEVKADNQKGWIRAIRYEEGFDENSSRLMSLWEILDDDAIRKVKKGLWKRVSGSFGVAVRRVIEGSIVVFGAYDRGPGDRAEILKKKGQANMSKPNPPAPETTPDKGAAPAAQTEVAPLAAAPLAAPAASVAPAAPSHDVAEMSAELSQMRVEMAQMRAREDASDFRLLMAEGYSTPANEVKEVAFLGKLPRALKDEYLSLRRTLPKAWQAGRESVPSEHSPLAATSSTGTSQDALLAQLQEQSGVKPAGK